MVHNKQNSGRAGWQWLQLRPITDIHITTSVFRNEQIQKRMTLLKTRFAKGNYSRHPIHIICDIPRCRWMLPSPPSPHPSPRPIDCNCTLPGSEIRRLPWTDQGFPSATMTFWIINETVLLSGKVLSIPSLTPGQISSSGEYSRPWWCFWKQYFNFILILTFLGMYIAVLCT